MGPLQILATKSAPLAELLRELGAPDPERAAQIVAKHNSLSSQRIEAGTKLSIPDEVMSAMVQRDPVEGEPSIGGGAAISSPAWRRICLRASRTSSSSKTC